MLNVSDCRELLELYQQMAAAAERNDWENLAALEARANALRSAASGHTASGQPASTPDAAESAELRTLIEQILELDAAIRLHAEPALASTRKLLASSVRGRNVRDAYQSV